MDTIVTPVTVITLDSTRIVHSIKADLVARYFPPVVRLVQYDQSLPVIAVSLMKNGQAYTLPNGAAANIRVHKPDATYVYNPALGSDSTRNIVYFEVTQAMAAANGDGLAIVEIVVDGDIAGTSLITLHFEENPVPEDAIESSDEWETIYELGERIIASTVTPVSTAAGMTDHNVVYLYTGTESGWNQGHMYYYNGTTWVDAGIAVTDKTLTVEGMAADAKTVGDRLTTLDSDVANLKASDTTQNADISALNEDIGYKTSAFDMMPLATETKKGYYQYYSIPTFTVADYYVTKTFDAKAGQVFSIHLTTKAGNKNTYPYYVAFDSSDNVLQKWGNEAGQTDLTLNITMPANTAKVAFTYWEGGVFPTITRNSSTAIDKNHVDILGLQSYWKGKKIVWFGTSIPAGTYNRGDKYVAYPDVVGEILGANVINESVGSSAVCRRNANWVDSSNPYGFPNNFTEAVKTLTNNLTIQQWLIDNYNSSKWTAGRYSTMTAEQQAEIKSWSYENKLDQYLTDSTFPDLFVFDHGRNDQPDSGTYSYETLRQTYGDDNLFCYRGGMNFLIRRILAFNPKAKIVQISHYENQQTPSIVEKQKAVCDDWSIKFVRYDDIIGWSQQTITTTGYWSNGRWQKSGGASQNITMLNANLADGVHPSSDLNGYAINKIAEILAGLLNGLYK